MFAAPISTSGTKRYRKKFMSEREANTRSKINTWYNKISEETRAALMLVDVKFVPWDIWTNGCYFTHVSRSWAPGPNDDPEQFARKIIDMVARDHAARTRQLSPP